VTGLFVATWLVAVAIWKYGRFEQRASAAFDRPAVEGD
jgi:hypothetical protein